MGLNACGDGNRRGARVLLLSAYRLPRGELIAVMRRYGSPVSGRQILAVAHRAGNSLADLRAALDAGVDLVEADVRLFRDALEVRHCKAIGRHLFWDGWDVNRRRSLAVPDLAEVLAAADGDPRLMLDLKGPGLSVAPRVAGLLRHAAPG